MYSVMIVDDEPLMLKYLSSNLTRIAPDWCVTGLASDGLQAVELLQRQPFDLVITDIKMPEMDGLELAKFIDEIHPQTRVVIISGFDDFDYARRAIRCGVSDYLLKPLSDENISETLKKIAEEMDENKTLLFPENTLGSIGNLSDPELKSAFLNAVIQDNPSAIKSIYAAMHGRPFFETNRYSCVLALCVDSAALLAQGSDYPKIVSCKMCLNQQSVEMFQDDARMTVCYDDCDNTVFFLCGKSENEVLQTMESVSGEVRRYFNEKENPVRLIGAYGLIADDFLSLPKSYAAAVQAVIFAFTTDLFPIPPAFFISQRIFLNGVHTLLSSIYSDFISENESKMRADIANYFSLFSGYADPLVSLRFGIYLLFHITQKSRMRKELLERAFQQLVLSLKTPQMDQDSRKSMIDVFVNAVFSLKKKNFIRDEEENNDLVEKAKEYIYSHSSEPISLTLIAEKLGVSACYLSDLFHKEVGEPYSKFIIRVRMEKTISLMRTNPNEKLYAIATQVGFVNTKHFNSVFKKFYHMTPTEFMQKK